MDIKELQKIMQENGVVGAGGAGFPTYMKLTDKADTILMNCAECEPAIPDSVSYNQPEVLHTPCRFVR